jgi:hypothetical protein
LTMFDKRAALGIAREMKTSLRIARDMKTYLGMGAGAIRDRELQTSGPSRQTSARVERLERAGKLIARKARGLRIKVWRRLGGKDSGIKDENVVWIFGAARTGSTWLSRMMGELDGQTVWREPLVGALFGNLYYDRAKHLIGKTGKHYILGDGYRDSWLDSMRTFVLNEATGRFPASAGPGKYLVIKEPNGSLGAPLLMQAMPGSRMILLVRDPRDAVASSMDAKRKGGWQYENRNKGARGRPGTLVDKDPDAFVRERAKAYLQRIMNTKQAYDNHKGPKVLVRYEDLRADTLGTMRRIYSALRIPVDEGNLAKAVQKHSWERIPEEEKGEGKVFRKATPGGWREDLTPEQVDVVERITAPILEEFYPLEKLDPAAQS